MALGKITLRNKPSLNLQLISWKIIIITSIATYIDFKKAFDTVNHKLLIGKLKKYGLGSNLLKLLTSYLSDRMQFTVIN